eukprot:COSAG01_NODE_5223_length_4402_cov_3.387869_6_plen_92_part_00
MLYSTVPYRCTSVLSCGCPVQCRRIGTVECERRGWTAKSPTVADAEPDERVYQARTLGLRLTPKRSTHSVPEMRTWTKPPGTNVAMHMTIG